MTLNVEWDQVTEMYEVAHDHELAVLDDLAERAGLRWTCQPKPEHDCPWTNHTDEPCGRCERTRQQAREYDAQPADATEQAA